MKRGEVGSPISLAVLRALADGPSSAASLHERISSKRASLQTAIHTLYGQGHILKAEHGRYTLSDSGRAVIGLPPIGVEARPVPVKSLPIKDTSLKKLLAEGEKFPGRTPLPLYRNECADGPRPCPLVRCRYHLFLEVLPTGTIVFNHPGVEPWELKHSCALDVADDGTQTLEDIASALGVTRESIRLIEIRAKAIVAEGTAEC